MARGKPASHIASISGKIGGSVYRTSGTGMQVSSEPCTRHGTTGGSSIQAELLAADMHTWSTLSSAERDAWARAAEANNTTARKYWLAWRSWDRVTKDHSQWQTISQNYAGNLMGAIVYIPAYHRVVALAQDGTPRIRYTDDGLVWTACTGTTQGAWSDACFCLGFGLVIAIAYGGSIRAGYSYDGVAWTSISVPELNQWLACAYSQDLRIAVAVAANGTNRMMYTTSGTSWTLGTGGGTEAWAAVAWSDTLGRFAAVATSGTYRAAYTDDGVNWTLVTMPVLNVWRCVCWCGWLQQFIALGASSTASLAWTDDGATWHTKTGPGNRNWYDVISIEPLHCLVAVALGATVPLWVSYDGDTWTAISNETATNLRAACWSPWHGSVYVGAYSTPGKIIQSAIAFTPTDDNGVPLIADHMDPMPGEIAQLPIAAMSCPSVDYWAWTLTTAGEEQRLSLTTYSQLQTGAGIAWIEVLAGRPIGKARNYYKGAYASMGLRPISSTPYAPPYFVYPFEGQLGDGSRLPVKMRVLARGGRSSPWVEGIATITT